MMGPFIKPPMVRMGSQNYMRGVTYVFTASTDLGGCALIRFTLRGPGGGGGGMVRREPGSFFAPNRADGERGSAGSIASDRTRSVRPGSAGYVHVAGGTRGDSQLSTASILTATAGATPSAASLMDVTASGGDGGDGAALDYPSSVTSHNRSPVNVTNPDGINTAGRGGFGGNKDSGSSPSYGAGAGGNSRAWVTILD